MTDSSPTSNPYQSPTELKAEAESSPSARRVVTEGLSDDCRGNLGLSSKIIKIASVIFGIASLVSAFQILVAFRFYGFPNGWTWWHSLICYRIVYTPCWLLLAWMMWKYAKSLDRMADKGVGEVEAVVERQAKAWLAAGLLLFMILIGLAISFSGALRSYIPRFRAL